MTRSTFFNSFKKGYSALMESAEDAGFKDESEAESDATTAGGVQKGVTKSKPKDTANLTEAEDEEEKEESEEKEDKKEEKPSISFDEEFRRETNKTIPAVTVDWIKKLSVSDKRVLANVLKEKADNLQEGKKTKRK